MSFPCNICGACCRHLKLAPMYRELDRGDGVCRFLNGNICSIYEKCPLICRIDDAWNVFFKNYVSREEYYRINMEYCKKFQAGDL